MTHLHAERHAPKTGHTATGHDADHAAADHAAPRRWLALSAVALAQFMLVLDVTVVNVALPDIAADLHLVRSTLTWVVTAYTLCFGGLMLLGGRLADALGARRMVLTGLTLFTAASALAGTATGAPMLLTGRVAQGVAAALLSPAALSIVTTTFHGADRTKALGIWSAIAGGGSALGVLLGGVLTGGPGWHWIFAINVPVGVALLIAIPFVVPARAGRPTRLDAPGALLVTAATGALIYGLVKAGDAGWTSATVLGSIAAAFAGYAIFAAVERRVGSPLIDLRLLKQRSVAAGSFLMLVSTALLIAFFFLGSLYVQHVRGFSPVRTGVFFLPVAVSIAVGAHLGSHLIGHLGSRTTAVAGLALAALGSAPLATVSATSTVYGLVLPGIAVAAFGLGTVLVTANATALAHARPEEAGLTSGLVNTFHEVGAAVGVAVMSTVAASGIEHGTAGGFARAFRVCAAVAVLGAVAAVAVVPQTRTRAAGLHGGH